MRLAQLRPLGASLLVAVALCGCGPVLGDHEILGEKQKLIFSLFECVSCSPVAIRVGSRKANLSVSIAELAFPVGHRKLPRGTFGLASSDPALIATSVNQANDPPTFVMEPLAEGTARIAVLDASGAELDATRVTAAKATRLTMFSDTATRAGIDSIEVGAGAELNVFVRADGAAGPLVTGAHWTWWTEDASVATLWDPGGALLVPNATSARLEDSMEFVYLQGKRSGATRLHVADANAEAVIQVVVP